MSARVHDLLGPESPLAELLLADVAIRVELPPSQHRLAVERYEAVCAYLGRDGSPLSYVVRRLYPQGSMAIRATIRARRRDDGYDIDVVVELNLPRDTPPAAVLDRLYRAMKGDHGSRYYGMVKKQSRCVTIKYADGMYIDLTPAVRLDPLDERKSRIFHAKETDPPAKHYVKTMNAWAFCEHVKEKTPADVAFRDAYRKRVQIHDRGAVKADAEVDEVPGHAAEEGGKSALIVAHQLMKRNRNVRYQDRKGMRMPPSVAMAADAIAVEVAGGSILEALDALTRSLLDTLERAERQGELVNIRNPQCAEDRFTDRWPENQAAQRLYISDLKLLKRQLSQLGAGDLSLEEYRILLAEMFGEGPAEAVIKDRGAALGEAVRRGARRHLPSGQVVVPAGLAAGAAAPPARAHTFFGGRVDDQ